MIEHIEYEVTMLLGSAAELDKRDRGRVMELQIDHPRRIARTAFLEVFLIHSRALDEFLGKHPGRPDDLWAGDYVAAWAERPIVEMYYGQRNGTGPLYPSVRKRINKQLAHVTTQRMDNDSFPIAEMARDIRMALSAFVQNEAIRGKPEFESLRALVDDDKKWMIRIFCSGS
jgi:hypothetical protein